MLGLAVGAVVQAPHRDGHDLNQRVAPALGEVCGLTTLATRVAGLATRWLVSLLHLQLGGWCLAR